MEKWFYTLHAELPSQISVLNPKRWANVTPHRRRAGHVGGTGVQVAEDAVMNVKLARHVALAIARRRRVKNDATDHLPAYPGMSTYIEEIGVRRHSSLRRQGGESSDGYP